MRICYIAVKGMPLGGGIEKYTEEVGSRLAARGHRIVVYAMRHYGARSGEYKGMEVRALPTLRAKSAEKLTVSFLASIAQTVRAESDIIHFHAFGPAMFCALPRIAGRRVVVQGHSVEWKRARWRGFASLALRLMEIPSVRCPHAVTVVSKGLQEYLWQKYRVASEYIPSGVNPPVFEQPDLINGLSLESRRYILFMSRLVPEKGAHHLIKAFRRLRTDLRLVLAGDANEEQYKQELRTLADDDPRIILPGFVTGRLQRELMSHCLLFVQPSEIEGMSISLLEAMSYGNCCLMSDISENLEVGMGRAVSFRSGDADNLAEKIHHLIQDQSGPAEMAGRAQRHVLQNHSWDVITDQMEAFYMKVLHTRSAATTASPTSGQQPEGLEIKAGPDGPSRHDGTGVRARDGRTGPTHTRGQESEATALTGR